MYKDNLRHGQGLAEYQGKKGGFYEGAWVKDKKHGYGVFKYSNGNIYKGDWRVGLKHGDATYYYASNSKLYKGLWANGQPKTGTVTS